MKAFARFKTENWCMDLAYVDKLTKDINSVKYLLLRRDVFDRTVDTKGKKNKRFQGNGSCIFDHDHKKTDPRKFAGEFKKFAKLKEYKITLQWVRLKLHLLNNTVLEKYNVTFHGRLWL